MIKAIYAKTSNNLFGINNNLPWTQWGDGIYNKLDMLNFKTYTKEKNIIMGMKTWESIGSKPLKNRKTHYIITKTFKLKNYDNVEYITFDEFIEMYKKKLQYDGNDYIVIGGSQILELFLPHIEEINETVFWMHSAGKKKFKYEGEKFTYLELDIRKYFENKITNFSLQDKSIPNKLIQLENFTYKK